MFIYALIDPETGEIRYIGKTVDLKSRINHHIVTARRGRYEHYKDRWIRSLLSRNLVPRIAPLITTDEEHWKDDERFIIAGLRSAGVRLTNTTAGGEGVDIPHTAEWHAKIGARHRGKVVGEEQREKIRQALLAKTTHCPQGHEYTPENTGYGEKDGRKYRVCKQCRRDQAEKVRRQQGAVPISEYKKSRPKTCKRGHPMSGDNLRVLVRKDGREEHICRECVRTRNRLCEARRRVKCK